MFEHAPLAGGRVLHVVCSRRERQEIAIGINQQPTEPANSFKRFPFLPR